MVKTWTEVIASDGFADLPETEKYAIRERYFDKFIAPDLGEDERETVKREFYERSHDMTFGESLLGLKEQWSPVTAVKDMARVAGGLPFNLGDKAIAAVRAGLDEDLDYGTALEEERDATRQARERAGWAGTAMDVALGAKAASKLAANGLSLSGREAVQNSNMLTKMAAGAVEGGVAGAAYGVGGADAGFDLEENAAAAVPGAIMGAGVGAAAAPVASMLSNTMQKLLGQGGARAQLDGKDMTAKAQSIADKNFAPGSVRDQVINQMDERGQAAMALNANPQLKGLAAGLSTEGDDAGRMVQDALVSQQKGRTQRLLDETSDALGPVSGDNKAMLERIEQLQKVVNKRYDVELKGLKVGDERKAVIAAAQQEIERLGSSHRVSTALRKYTDLKNLPTNGLQLKNLLTDIDAASAKYPGATVHFENVKRAVGKALDVASGGRYSQRLTQPLTRLHEQREAIEMAQGFLETDGPLPREIASSSKFHNPKLRKLMQKAVRNDIDLSMRGNSNKISQISNTVGRDASDLNRARMGVVFGDEATEKVAALADREMRNSKDAADIVSNSSTAMKQAGRDQLADSGLAGWVPEDVSTARGILGGLVRSAIKKARALTGNTERTRKMVAKIVTMNQKELQSFMKELDRAAKARSRNGQAAVSAVGATTAPLLTE